MANSNLEPHHSPPYSHGQQDPYLPEVRMPSGVDRQYSAEMARGVLGNGHAQANTYIASAYVQGASMLTGQALSAASQLAELEAIAIERAPWAEARIHAIGDSFAATAISEITNLRRNGGRR